MTFCNLQVHAHIATSTTDIINRWHKPIKLVDWLSKGLCSNVDQHAKFWFEILTKTSEEVKMRVYFLIIEVFDSCDKINLEQVIFNLFYSLKFIKSVLKIIVLDWYSILKTVKQIHNRFMTFLLWRIMLTSQLVTFALRFEIIIKFFKGFAIKNSCFRFKAHYFIGYFFNRKNALGLPLISLVKIIENKIRVKYVPLFRFVFKLNAIFFISQFFESISY